MKKIMMIVALMVATLSASAQNEVGQFSLKPMAGVNLATLTNLTDNKLRVGLAAGVEAEYGIAKNVELSLGALYSMQGSKYTQGDAKLIAKVDYINIPVLLNVYLTKGLAIKAGIQPGFKASAKLKLSEGSASISDDLEGVKGFNLSVPFGASYEYQGFVLDVRYNLGVTKVFKDLTGNNDKTIKNSVIMFTLGYKIPF